MRIDEFIQTILKEFPEKSGAKADDNFKEFLGWSSLNILILASTIKEKFDVNITNQELRKLQTFADLYDLVISRKTK